MKQCAWCVSPAVNALCDPCSELNRQRCRARYHRIRAASKCTHCGGPSPRFFACLECRRARQLAKVAA